MPKVRRDASTDIATQYASDTPKPEPLSEPGIQNLVLASLSPEQCEPLEPHIERLTLEPMQLLCEMGDPVDYVYFPETAVISAVRPASDGTYIETATVGREGMAGIAVYFSSDWSLSRLEAQVPGKCQRIKADVFRGALEEIPSLRRFVGKFVLSFLDQVSQSVICTSRHSLARRCARWLLMAHDRVAGDTFELTHETLARMLDVRRAGVTQTAVELKRRGLIDYRRGAITVIDRAGLETCACECYALNRANLDALYKMAAGELAAGRT